MRTRLLFVVWLGVCKAFVADYFGQLCTGVVGFNKGSPCSGKDWYSQDPDCMCQNQDYLKSLYSCITTASAELEKPEVGLKDSWRSVEVQCKLGHTKMIPYTTVAKWLASEPLNRTWTEANTTGQPGSFSTQKEIIVNGNVVAAGKSMHGNEKSKQPYAEGRLYYVLGIMMLQILFNFTFWVIPAATRALALNGAIRWIRRNLTMPALFGKSKAHPIEIMPDFQVFLPQRMHTLLIIGYIALTTVLLSVNYSVELSPYYKYYWEPGMVISSYLGQRAGSHALIEFPLLILFGGRNNVLIWLTGWDYTIFLLWHRWLARIFTAELGIHAIAYTVYRGYQHRLPSEYTKTYFIWGFVGLICIFFLCLTGLTRTIRERSYETFLVLHVIFAVFAVVGAYWHNNLLDMNRNMQAMYAVVAIWAFDRAVRVVRVLANNPLAKCTIEHHNTSDVIVLDIEHSGLWTPQAGSYVWVHFITDPWRFWQCHPFTAIPTETGALRLYAQARSGITRSLVQKHTGKQCTVWLDGPYGLPFNTRPFQDLVFMAGGMGITAATSHLIPLLSKNQRLYLHWVIRDDTPLEWFRRELDRLHEKVTICIYITNSTGDQSIKRTLSLEHSYPESSAKLLDSGEAEEKESINTMEVQWSRPSIHDIIDEHVSHATGSLGVYVCGPGRFTDDVREAVTDNIGRSKQYIQLFEESFSL